MTLRSHIRFQEPPARSQRPTKRTKHEKIAATLRKHPADWALIAAYSTAASSNSIAYIIRKGKLAAYEPAGAFEAVSRRVGDTHRVYARYVGEGGADE